MSDWVNVAKVGAIASGDHKIVEIDGTQIAVFNIGGELADEVNICD